MSNKTTTTTAINRMEHKTAIDLEKKVIALRMVFVESLRGLLKVFPANRWDFHTGPAVKAETQFERALPGLDLIAYE